jgi:hypothetical protein
MLCNVLIVDKILLTCGCVGVTMFIFSRAIFDTDEQMTEHNERDNLIILSTFISTQERSTKLRQFSNIGTRSGTQVRSHFRSYKQQIRDTNAIW